MERFGEYTMPSSGDMERMREMNEKSFKREAFENVLERNYKRQIEDFKEDIEAARQRIKDMTDKLDSMKELQETNERLTLEHMDLAEENKRTKTNHSMVQRSNDMLTSEVISFGKQLETAKSQITELLHFMPIYKYKAEPLAHIEDKEHRVMECLIRHEHGMYHKSILEQTELDPKEIARILKRLKKDDIMEQKGRVYGLTLRGKGIYQAIIDDGFKDDNDTGEQ